jgi:intein/homing endonuclease
MHNTQKEAEKSRSWIWYLSALIILLVSGSIYIYIRKHKKSVQAIEQSRESYNKEKTEMRKDVLLKKRVEFMANVERIKSKQKGSERMDKRVNDAYNELLHIQDAALFFCEMDKSYNNIVTKLQANAPDIKEKELIWCCLQLLDVPTHDMLILLDYESVNSLKRMKGRLAPKLGLENAGFISDYLLQLLTAD